MKRAYWFSGIALVLLCSMTMSAWAAADDDVPNNAVLSSEAPLPEPPPPSEYWLGIQLAPLPPLLRVHLNLPENQGFVVAAVVPESPAAKAGVSENDVILKADGKIITDVPDLLKAVDEAKDKELKLDVIHDGRPKTVAVTPVKRPEEFRPPLPPSQLPDFQELRNSLEQLEKSLGRLQPGARFRGTFIKPGVILPPGAPIHPPLPGNMSISVTKTGDKPADIVVRMDDEKWQVTEKDLDKLPAKVQPYVKRMLGMSTGVPWMSKIVPDVVMPALPQMPAMPELSGPTPGEPGIHLPQMTDLDKKIEKRFEEMNRRIEKLRQELRGWRHEDNPPQEPPPPQEHQPPPPAEI
jgi:hypothetical protein